MSRDHIHPNFLLVFSLRSSYAIYHTSDSSLEISTLRMVLDCVRADEICLNYL